MKVRWALLAAILLTVGPNNSGQGQTDPFAKTVAGGVIACSQVAFVPTPR